MELTYDLLGTVAFILAVLAFSAGISAAVVKVDSVIRERRSRPDSS